MDVEVVQQVDEQLRDDLSESRQMQLCRKAHKRISLKTLATNRLFLANLSLSAYALQNPLKIITEHKSYNSHFQENRPHL
jgi:hypothetical protein